MSAALVLCGAFLAIWAVALGSSDPNLVRLLLANAAVQLPLFVLVACRPFLRTGRMSYVDIAWPFGVAAIGAAIALLGEGEPWRRFAVATIYAVIGLRMGIGALVMAKTTGVIVKHEFPRYRYRRMVLDRSGTRHVERHMLVDILAQGFANLSVLALPGFLIATSARTSISPWEIVGLGLWAVAYVFETVADGQKLLFISKKAEGVCDVGLWRYSRHPNYFAEWLVWSGLVIAALPSWWALRGVESALVWGVLGGGTVGAAVAMYLSLVYLTGAVPAEYYSARKREGYRAYQERTSRFFPWFPRG